MTSIVLALAGIVASAPSLAEDSSHPLDPLSKEEVAAAVELLKAAPDFPADGVFPVIVLHEPPKDEVLRFSPGGAHRREAFAVVYDRPKNRMFEAVVDLRQRKLIGWKHIPDQQPVVMDYEGDELARMVKANADWQAAMRRRGINDFTQVQVDVWAAGRVAKSDPPGSRLLRAVSYSKADGKNFYGRPIEGVVALVNMTTGRVVQVTDTGVRPVPPPGQDLDEASVAKTVGKLRAAPKPLHIHQPDGPSFDVRDNEVRWQKWRFRFALLPREGLVLYTVGYEDAHRLRPILYRASLSEMVVPYGDSDTNWTWRNAFDVGEYGVGSLSTELVSGFDVPENAQLFNAVIADETGTANELPHRVAIYERDGGLLWKHADYTHWTEARRGRQLVVFFITSIGNYDYGIQWVFHQDGVIELDAVLTGIMLPKGVVEKKVAGHGEGSASGHLVAPRVVAPHHQHFFNFRLDLDVDGTSNSVVEMNTRPGPADGESLNEMIMEEMLLGTETAARRNLSMDTARKWAVVNSAVKNSLGYASSYILIHGDNSIPYASPRSAIRQRAGFIDHHVWVTRFHPSEMNAAGAYPNQSRGGDGLPQWVADDESIDKEDVVLWYTLGVTHIPRAEEWPVMPATHVGFKLIPAGFFTMNPALDVPR